MFQVLVRIPEKDFKKLDESALDSWQWFIPDGFGEVFPFTANIHPTEKKGELQRSSYARVLYLSPLLNQMSESFVIGLLAHELAHIVLDHEVYTETPEQYEAQENEAWNLIKQWGFSKEEKQHAAYYKRIDAVQDRMLRKLKEKSQQIRKKKKP